MTGLIVELQRAAMDEQASIGSLLRKAIAAAGKLRVQEFEDWARMELEGFGENPVPPYRRLKGQVMVWNPYRGYQPLEFSDSEFAAKMSEMHMNMAVDELEAFVAGKGEGGIAVSYRPSLEQQLMDGMDPPLKPSVHFPAPLIKGILGRVRTIVLDWALKLEKQGVLGENMTFSVAERVTASTINIETLIQGTANSQIQVRSVNSTQQQGVGHEQLEDIARLIQACNPITEAADTSDIAREIVAELQTLQAQVASPRPNRSVLRHSMESLQRVLEGAAGSALATKVPDALAILGKILGAF